MDKNISRNKEFLQVKEFAKLVGITEASLRNYDKKGIFSPAKRGADGKNRYRYYSPTQITLVKMLRVLTEIGVPLKIIRELSERRNPEILLKLLNKSRDKIAAEIRFLQEVGAVINTFTDLLTEAVSAEESELTVAEAPEKRLIMGEPTDFKDGDDFLGELLRFYQTPREPKLNPSFPVGGYWDDMADFLKKPSRPARFFSISPDGNEKKARGLYLIGYTRGYYGQTNDLPRRMAAFAEKNGLIFNGPVYNIYLSEEVSESDPDRYLLQVSASVSETAAKNPRARRPHRRL